MKYFLLICCLSVVSTLSRAHPGIGIVKDSRGNIYYTDLSRVWKIDPATQQRKIVVPGVHTHELYIDAGDNLYGEHVWYNGERLDTWGHYTWCLKNDGTLVKEPPAEGFRTGYSFVRDSAGNMYWVERFTTTRFMKKTPDGTITKLAGGKFGLIAWLYSTPGGTIYFTENNRLKKLTPDGRVHLMAGLPHAGTTGLSTAGRYYDDYGIWTDKAGNVYIAMLTAKIINRISPGGTVETIWPADSSWAPCSGLFDDKGNLWLMEFSASNQTRVRMIPGGELRTGKRPARPLTKQVPVIAMLSTGIAIAFLLILYRFLTRKRILKRAAPLP